MLFRRRGAIMAGDPALEVDERAATEGALFGQRLVRAAQPLTAFALDCVRELLAHGATWNPSEAHELNSLRRTLLECEPDVTIELLLMLRKHNACPAERVHTLLRTPRMKEHLKAKTDALLRLGIHLDARPNASRH